MKFFRRHRQLPIGLIAILLAVLTGGCISVKQEGSAPRLLKSENATQKDLATEVNRFARVRSMRAKMYLKFEDNSFAEFGSKEVYRSADGDVIVQRPAMILMKVQVPVIRTDVAQMSSDGETFRVAVLQDGGSGKYKKFVKGTNNADYSGLQRSLSTGNENGDKRTRESVNAFANLRPQHFTDALLVRPTDAEHVYTVSTTFVLEEDMSVPQKSPLRKVTRGYYLFDEYLPANGRLLITRRFWFDRVGGIRLARQQIFDAAGEIDSDITYGKEGKLSDSDGFTNLPLEIIVTRPKERYAMRLTYQSPEDVTIDREFPASAFVLKNSWGLDEVDLDRMLQDALPKPVNTSGGATTPRNQ